jgi:uncharacterized protein (DUF433 family)
MRFTKTIASASVAAVLGIAGVSVAGAASSSGSSAPTAAPGVSAPATTKKARPAMVRRRLRRAGVKLAAKTIGITPADLVKELRAGKTIAAVATAHGVQPQAVIDALKAAATKKIEAAKAAGKITPERAVRLQQRFDVAIPKFVNDWHPRAAS